jgi:hypothetical protein
MSDENEQTAKPDGDITASHAEAAGTDRGDKDAGTTVSKSEVAEANPTPTAPTESSSVSTSAPTPPAALSPVSPTQSSSAASPSGQHSNTNSSSDTFSDRDIRMAM